MTGNRPKDVFNIIEGSDGKSKWTRIGAAFVNKDGSINAILDTYPNEGKIQIRERRARGEKSEGNN